MIFKDEPTDFLPKFEVVSCFISRNDEILLLKRAHHKPQGNTWGVPAGKIEPNENKEAALVREIREETGIILNIADLRFFRTLFVRYPSYDFKYHIFSTVADSDQIINIDNSSHTEHKWLLPSDALKLDLILDEDYCIKLFYNLQ